MRIVRRIIAALLVPVLLLVATVVGAVLAIVFTPMGHRLLARAATQWISQAIAGQVTIGGIRGNIWSHIELDDVVIRDGHNVVVVRTPRIAASYLLPGLLAHRLIFNQVRADSLELHLVRSRAGRWNYETLFHMGEGAPGGGGPPPRVAFNDLQVNDASLRIDVPTTPGPPRQAASRNGRAAAQPRLEPGADGPVRVYTASDLTATFRLLRVSTPRHDPLLARITALRTRFNDPAITITQLTGEIIAAGDSLRFQLDSAALPSTRLMGGGAVRWPDGPLLFDFALDVPRVALRDLWWIQPDFPDWEGRGHVIAKSLNSARTNYRLDNLVLGRGPAGVAGTTTVVIDSARGLGMRGLNLQLRNTPIDLLRPYLDTLPVSGGLTGHLAADGFLDSLRLGGDVVFADALVAGAPATHLRINGVAHFGGPDGAVFQQFHFDQSVIALGTVHQLVPSVLIRGNLTLNGELDGPWKNARFVGTVEHAAPGNALSRLVGSVRLDTRGPVLGLAVDADLDELSFDALRSGYPSLPARGGLTGHLIASGNLDSLELNTTLSGEIGTITALGRVRVDAPNYGADSLILDLERVDAEAMMGHGTSTALNGRIIARGVIDSGVPPRGTLTLSLDRSRVGGATVDAVTGVVHADHGVLTVDTGTVQWSDGRVDARGTLGWAAPDSGTLQVQANATSLAPFDSLVRVVSGVVADSIHAHPLDGQAQATLTIAGSLDAATVAGTVTGSQVRLDDWHAATINATLRADSLGQRHLALAAHADTIGRGAHVADSLQVTIDGKPDSLRLAGSVGMVGLAASGGGTWLRSAQVSHIQLDSLSLNFPHQQWRLVAPTRIAIAGAQVALGDTVRLRSVDGSGVLRVSGTMPGDTPGKLDASVTGLDLLDIFGVMERDTTALDGWGALDLHLAGTRDAPTFQGSASIIGPVLGEIHAPSVQATFDYRAQRLNSDVSLWRTGRRVLEGKVSLPLDLALASRPVRKLPGPLQISGIADSVDMVTLGALIPTIRDPSGTITLHLAGAGTWEAPDLKGTLAIHDGRMSVPSLNVQYGPINGAFRFVKDSVDVDSLTIGSSDGSLQVQGGIRLAQLDHPTLNLSLKARDFLAINAASFLTLRATGDMRLRGPLWQPVLTGDRVVFTRSVFYFADLITKNVIDLEAPENAALVDTAALRQQGLRNDFSNRFLDSLRIDGLTVRIGDDVWLRSAQANIQLDGDLTVNKDHQVWGLTGVLNAPRGTYTLQLGPINRDFSVDQGTVRYYGQSDNADLSIQAHNQVRTIDGDDFNVVATISGTMTAPTVQLSAPGRNLTQVDLLSYVLFGRSEFQLTASQQTSASSSVLTGALDALFGEISQSVISRGSGIGLSTLTIQPGATPGAVTSGSSVTQLAAGLQLSSRTFVTFDAGLCLTSQAQNFQKRNFGASIEYRFARDFRIQAAAEPVQSCITNRAADVFTTLSRYELGGDLLWQRNY